MQGDAPRGRKRVASTLSLHAFAQAKKSKYDPREIKEKERALASRTVKKYKKIQRRLAGSQPAEVRGGPAAWPMFWVVVRVQGRCIS